MNKIISPGVSDSRSEGKNEVQDNIYSTLTSFSKYYCGILIIGQLIMQVNCLELPLTPANPNRLYFFIHMLLFISTCILLIFDLVWHKKSKSSNKLYVAVFYCHMLSLALWSCGISSLDLKHNAHLTVFTYVMIIISLFFTMKPWQSILLYFSSHVTLNILAKLLYKNASFLFPVFIGSLAITSCCTITSILVYKSRVKKFERQMYLEQQYDQMKKINDQLTHDIMIDSLTGLHNRKYLNEELNILDKDETGVFCIMMDIDYFKDINDTYGHPAGDICLIKLSNIIQDFFESKDAQVIRYGGEEFVVFRWNSNSDIVTRECEKIRSLIQNTTFNGNTKNLPITVSIGITSAISAETADGELSLDKLIKCADIALYTAKRAGRNKVEKYFKP